LNEDKHSYLFNFQVMPKSKKVVKIWFH